MPDALGTVSIDGSHGEGGGALLRTAVAMSALTQQPLEVHKLRGGLRKAGLSSEDLTFVQALADATKADSDGAVVGSTVLSFRPKQLPRPLVGSYDVHAHEKGRVPGNALIVLTGLLPILARAGGYSEIAVRAETHNEKTICYDAFERTTLAAMRRFGLYASSRLVTPGFGYGAHGEVAVEVEPSCLQSVEWAARGGLRASGAAVSTGDLPESVAQAASSSLQSLARAKGVELEIETVSLASKSRGATVTVWAEFENGFGSGTASLQPDGTIEECASHAFHRFCEWFDSDATVDPFLADQLLLLAVQAPGRTVFTVPTVTKRLMTMSWVVRQFMPIHLTVLGREGSQGTVTIEQ